MHIGDVLVQIEERKIECVNDKNDVKDDNEVSNKDDGSKDCERVGLVDERQE